MVQLEMNEALGLDAAADSDSSSRGSVNHSACRASALLVTNEGPSKLEEENISSPVKVDGRSPAKEDIISDLIAKFEAKFQSQCSLPELDDVYLIYCEYARLKGFSVRKGDQRYIGQTQNLRWKQYVCSATGPSGGTRKYRKVAKYRKQVTRTECTAKIRVHPVDGEFQITTFCKEHNHELVPANQTYLLRSSRNLTKTRQRVINSMRAVGIPVNVACAFMEEECGGPSNVGFIRKDVYDHLRRQKLCGTSTENGDAVALLEYFNKKSNEEPSFFWKAKYCNDGRLLHFFMRDTRSLNDYITFSDILSIDTTYKTNKYNLYCAPFVGLNHHSTNVMFGIGFMSDEKTETFEWLLDSFLEAMGGTQPGVVFSDQSRALMNAIDSKFPLSTHRLCQWHINNNLAKNLGSLNGNLEFKRMWYKCMNGVETEDEFEELWTQMMADHVRDENSKWLHDIYLLKRRWASVFTQDIFTAGMHATTRSEGTNRVLKAFSKSSNSLFEFATAYEKIQSRWREIEAAEDTACIWLPGQFVNKNSLLLQAATVYTRTIYKKLDLQLTEALNVEVDNENVRYLGDGKMEFKASRSGNNTARPRTIIFDPVTKRAFCSCHMFETHGIICRHILRVYIVRNVSTLPQMFILKRWTKAAKKKEVKPHCIATQPAPGNTSNHMDFVNVVIREQYDMASASRDSVQAQRFIYEQLEVQKRGLTILRRGGVPQSKPIPAPGSEQSDFQFLNPKKVKDRYEDKTSSKRGKRKGPGISTKSRHKLNSGGGSRDGSVEFHTHYSCDCDTSRFHATQ